MRYRFSGGLSIISIFIALLAVLSIARAATLSAGDLIKGSGPTVYYFGKDSKRYVFPNEKTFNSWYANFSGVKKITDIELSFVPLAGNVTYRPGTRLLKVPSDPRVYAVEGLQLRWIKSEGLAQTLFGPDWAKQIDDLPEVFFVNYTLGSAITQTSQYNPAEVRANYATIQSVIPMNPPILAGSSGSHSSAPPSSPSSSTSTPVAADTTAPSVPTGLAHTSSTISAIAISWTTSTDAVGVSGYHVFRGGSQIATTTLVTYTDTGLSASTTYAYTVSAFDAAGNESAASASLSASTSPTPDTTAPSVPAGLTHTSSTDSAIAISWTSSTDAVGVTGYHVFRDGTQVATTTLAAYTDTGLSVSTTYAYTVSAFDAAGNESATSTSLSASTTAYNVQFPLQVSSNSRYLMDQNSTPFRIHGDSPWDMPVNMTHSDIETYLNDRRDRGFNAIIVEITDPTKYSRSSNAPFAIQLGGSSSGTASLPFTKNISGGAWTGDLTFATDYTGGQFDAAFSSPNDTYFNWVGTMMDEAAERDILVIAVPSYVGYNLGSQDGWWNTLINSTNTQTIMYNFGRYLAEGNGGSFSGFKNKTNVMWAHGGDSSPSQQAGVSAEGTLRYQQLILGMIAGGANQLRTSHYKNDYLTTDDAVIGQYANVQAVYTHGPYPTHGPTYTRARQVYGTSTNIMPAFLIETAYEHGYAGGRNTTDADERRFYWGAELSAIGGAMFGSDYIWSVATANAWQTNTTYSVGSLVSSNGNVYRATAVSGDGKSGTGGGPSGCTSSSFTDNNVTWLCDFPDWKQNLATTGTRDFVKMGDFFDSIAWYNLVPSQLGGNRLLITSGGGTYANPGNPGDAISGGNDWIASASTLDRSLLVAYVPPSHSGAFTVDMTAMSGPSRARWFDPTDGTYTAIATDIPNTGTYSFTVPGNNARGANDDWVLVIDLIAAASINASPTSVSAGDSTTITWSSSLMTSCTASGGWSGAKSVTGTEVITNLQTSSTFSLACTGSSGSVSTSTVVTVTVPDTTAPSVPTGLATSTVSGTAITIRWTTSTDDVGVAGYKIYRDSVQVGTSTASVSFADSGLTASTTYSYRVSAYDAANNVSAQSSAFLVTTVSTSSIPQSNLVLYWQFEEGSGTTVAGSSGTSYTGTFSGGPTWVAGHTGTGVNFANANAMVSVSDVTEINSATQMTLAGWIKRGSSNSKVLFGKENTATQTNVNIEAWNDGILYFQVSNGTYAYGYYAHNDTNWHHVALVFDGTQTGNTARLKAYLDGSQITLNFDGTTVPSQTPGSGAFQLGKISGSGSDGTIDDVVVYSRALSASEVGELVDN